MSLDELMKQLKKSIKQIKRDADYFSRDSQKYVDLQIKTFIIKFLSEINLEIFLECVDYIDELKIRNSLTQTFVEKYASKLNIADVNSLISNHRVTRVEIRDSIIESYVNANAENIILRKFKDSKYFKFNYNFNKIGELIEKVYDAELKEKLLNKFSQDNINQVLKNHVANNASKLAFDKLSSLIKDMTDVDIKDSAIKVYFNENLENAFIDHYFNGNKQNIENLTNLTKEIKSNQLKQKLSDKISDNNYIQGILKKYFNENISQFNNQQFKGLISRIEDYKLKNEFLKKYSGLILEKRQNI